MSTVSSFEGNVRKPKGAVLFTGPDGIGDHRTTVVEQRYVGYGSMSPEASSDTQYLYRSAPSCPHPPPKTSRVGEVGWGVPRLSDNSLLKSGNQIKTETEYILFIEESTFGSSGSVNLTTSHILGEDYLQRCTVLQDSFWYDKLNSFLQLKEFRQAVEDRHTHLYQNPYYPPPQSSAHSTNTDETSVVLTCNNLKQAKDANGAVTGKDNGSHSSETLDSTQQESS